MDIRVCSPSKTTGKRSCCACTPETTPGTRRSSRTEEGSNPPGPAWKCFGAMLRISTGLELESLPPGMALPGSASPERAGNCVLSPKNVLWKLLGSKWAQRSSQEFFPFPEKSEEWLQLQDDNRDTSQGGHFHGATAGIKIKSILQILRPLNFCF